MRRPSTSIWLPRVRYWPHESACLSQTVTSTKQATSLDCPVCRSRYVSLTAIRSLATDTPAGDFLSSGSRVRLPSKITLFSDAMVASSLSCLVDAWPLRPVRTRAPMRGACRYSSGTATSSAVVSAAAAAASAAALRRAFCSTTRASRRSSTARIWTRKISSLSA